MSEREPLHLHCLACGEPLVAGLDECFACAPQPGATTLRCGVRYRVTAVTADVDGLVKALDALSPPVQGGSSRALVLHPPFDVVVEGTDLQHQGFLDLLSSATHAVISLDAPALPESLRWVGRPLAWKLGTTAALAGAAVALGTTSVLIASIGMATVLAGRGIHLAPRLLTPARESVDGLLDVLEPEARGAFRAARSALGKSATKGALDRFVAVVVAARREARTKGAHLRDVEARRFDMQLGRVMRETCAALVHAPRASGPDVAAGYREPASQNGAGDARAASLVGDAERAIQKALAAPGGAGGKAGILARHVAARGELGG